MTIYFFPFRWSFKYGDSILGCLTVFGGLVITRIFRRELKLLPYARLTCYAPVVGVASVTCFVFQNIFVSSEIVKSNRCPLCVSTKAIIGQVAFGLGYPLLAASLVCFYTADKLLTYPVPPLLKAPREVFQLAKKIVLKNPRPYLIIGAVHMIASSIITFQKQQTMARLNFKSSNYRI